MKTIVPYVMAAMLAATSADAADLPRRAAPPALPVAVPAFSWTGFYAGFNAGYAWSDDSVRNSNADGDPDTTKYISDLGISRVHPRNDGFAGGGQLGYNHQLTPGSGLVVGAEADAQYTDLNRRHTVSGNYVSIESPGTYTGPFHYETRNALEFLGTVRGRLGYAYNRVLIYGTGGFAYGQVQNDTVLSDAYTLTSARGAVLGTGTDRYVGRSSHFQTGYAYGGGIEYALPSDSILNVFHSSAVTLRAEYLRYDLGSQTVIGYDSVTRAAILKSKVQTDGNIVRAGLNYKFGSY